MPATKFICPNGQRIRIADCLCSCPNPQRCMFLLMIRAVANSLDRNIAEPTVTELISGVRKTCLKKTSAYAVDQQIKDDITSGQFDLFGKILDAELAKLLNLPTAESKFGIPSMLNLQTVSAVMKNPSLIKQLLIIFSTRR